MLLPHPIVIIRSQIWSFEEPKRKILRKTVVMPFQFQLKGKLPLTVEEFFLRVKHFFLGNRSHETKRTVPIVWMVMEQPILNFRSGDDSQHANLRRPVNIDPSTVVSGSQPGR